MKDEFWFTGHVRIFALSNKILWYKQLGPIVQQSKNDKIVSQSLTALLINILV